MLALCAIPAFSQPAFEVASLKPSPPLTAQNPTAAQMAQDRMFDIQRPGWLPIQKERLSLKNRPLAGLIASAFRVRSSQVSAPAWTTEDRYDIEATFPADTACEAVNDMLRTLLEDRFSLKTHRVEKEESGYALVETKDGVKLTPSAPSPEQEAAATTEEAAEKRRVTMQKRIEEMKKEAAANGGAGVSTNSWQGSVTFAQLADWLAPLLGRPVVDATGLQGKYDLKISIRRFGDDTEEYAAAQALAKLGLKLAARKITLPTVAVDHADRTPKPN